MRPLMICALLLFAVFGVAVAQATVHPHAPPLVTVQSLEPTGPMLIQAVIVSPFADDILYWRSEFEALNCTAKQGPAKAPATRWRGRNPLGTKLQVEMKI